MFALSVDIQILSGESEQGFLKEVTRVGLYDVLEAELIKDESEQESDVEKNQRYSAGHRPFGHQSSSVLFRFSRSRSAKDVPSIVPEAKVVGGLGLGSFLAPKETGGGLFTVNGTVAVFSILEYREYCSI